MSAPSCGILGRLPAPRGHHLTPDESARFWKHVNEYANADGCWRWTAGCFTGGMGAFAMRGKTAIVVRVAWLDAGRALADGARLAATCGNGWCCNPDHREVQQAKPRAPKPKRARPEPEAVTAEQPAPVKLPARDLALVDDVPDVVPITAAAFSDGARLALLSEPVTTAVATATWAIVYTRDHDVVGYGRTLPAACDDALRKRAQLSLADGAA